MFIRHLRVIIYRQIDNSDGSDNSEKSDKYLHNQVDNSDRQKLGRNIKIKIGI